MEFFGSALGVLAILGILYDAFITPENEKRALYKYLQQLQGVRVLNKPGWDDRLFYTFVHDEHLYYGFSDGNTRLPLWADPETPYYEYWFGGEQAKPGHLLITSVAEFDRVLENGYCRNFSPKSAIGQPRKRA